ncbi:MAG TPA: aminotransferase class I/II-fold pyridoxal phosphate-dependent enzyme [Thermomicrobiales bacterium]|nr:aminotransferase class I/II-fold pyridoxal phosphate-dependent enzyme [Thermomicrobiales bacterium]
MPIVEGMQWYAARDFASFATPGHRRGSGTHPDLIDLFGAKAWSLDIPVSGGATDVHFIEDVVEQAEALGADAWGADHCHYLVNGSSAGNLAFFLAHLNPGDRVIISRDIHKSLMTALIHTGVQPIYVAPQLHAELDFGIGIDPAQVERAIAANPDARLIALVSPSYSGVSSDLEAIAEVAHRHGVPVYVDEAWGPHFHFHPGLPVSAMAAGIDGAVTSTHKALAAFTQSAVLNVQGSMINNPRLKTTVGMSQTTSPAAYILASIDAVRSQMVLHGREMLERTLEMARAARERIRTIPGITIVDGETLGVARYDPTKFVIDVATMGITGFEAEHALRNRFHINPEASDLVSIVCFFTVGDSQATIDRLVSALETMARENRGKPPIQTTLRSSGSIVRPGIQVMTPRDAFFARSLPLPLAEAAGKVSADLVIPYPPGIPVIAPGDVIEQHKLDYLAAGVAHGFYISGAVDPELRTIQVVAD